MEKRPQPASKNFAPTQTPRESLEAVAAAAAPVTAKKENTRETVGVAAAAAAGQAKVVAALLGGLAVLPPFPLACQSPGHRLAGPRPRPLEDLPPP